MKMRVLFLLLSILFLASARAGELSIERVADLSVASDGAERLAFAPGPGLLLSTDPRQQEIHLHRADWSKPALRAIDAFPPTDELLSIPTPGRPMAAVVHPSQPFALALSRPRDVRVRGEVLFLDLREKSAGRLLRSQLVGFQPEHLAITPNGQWALIANEGEGSRRTPGSIGLLDLRNIAGWEVNRLQEVPYREFSGLSELFGSPVGRLEPEFVAIEPQGRLAAVTFQENDAVVWVDLRSDEPMLAGMTALPGGSEPAGISLLARQDGSVLAGIAEEGSQCVSFYRIALEGTEPHAELLSRIDIRPLVNANQPRKRRDPESILLQHVKDRSLAVVASERTDRVLLLDVTDPSQPRLMGRVATAAPANDFLALQAKEGLSVATGNGQGTISVLRVLEKR